MDNNDFNLAHLVSLDDAHDAGFLACSNLQGNTAGAVSWNAISRPNPGAPGDTTERDTQYDSACYFDPPTDLAPWQKEVLCLKVANTPRALTSSDIILLRGVLEAEEDAITAWIRQHCGGTDLERNRKIAIDETRLPYKRPVSLPSKDLNLAQTPADNNSGASHGIDDSVVPMHSVADGRLDQEPPHTYERHNLSQVPMVANHSTAFHRLQHGVLLSGFVPNNFKSSNLNGTALSEPRHPSNTWSTTSPAQAATGLGTNRVLRHFIDRFLTEQAFKGCGPIRSHERQFGKYICSLGCGRRFRTGADQFRHEEVVYPQEFFFIGNPNRPTKTCLFTREDKARKRLRDKGQQDVSTARYRVPGIRGHYPARCGICSTPHSGWQERKQHIKWHYKKGHFGGFTTAVADPLAQAALTSDDDNDDGDDHHGNGDDNPSDGQDDDQEGSGSDRDQDNGNGDGSDPPDNGCSDDDYDMDDSRKDFETLFTEFMHDWRGAERYPLSAQLLPLDARARESQGIFTELKIQWTERLKRGGTASVFRVQISVPPHDNIETGTYVIKQYGTRHRHLFEREKEAFTILQAPESHSSAFIRCYGTFEYANAAGEPLYNLVLEKGDCDLREFWAPDSQHAYKVSTSGFWTQMLRISEALSELHYPRRHADKSMYGVHADLKPDNIILVNGAFKVADFGFTTFFELSGTPCNDKLASGGGTPAYAAPEARDSDWSKSFRPARESDVFSFGRLLSEAVEWYTKHLNDTSVARATSTTSDGETHRTVSRHDHIQDTGSYPQSRAPNRVPQFNKDYCGLHCGEGCEPYAAGSSTVPSSSRPTATKKATVTGVRDLVSEMLSQDAIFRPTMHQTLERLLKITQAAAADTIDRASRTETISPRLSVSIGTIPEFEYDYLGYIYSRRPSYMYHAMRSGPCYPSIPAFHDTYFSVWAVPVSPEAPWSPGARFDVPSVGTASSFDMQLSYEPAYYRDRTYRQRADQDLLACPQIELNFTGAYRRSNRTRHLRQENNLYLSDKLAYRVEGCSRIFQRRDMYLKHHRKYHELDLRPTRCRGESWDVGVANFDDNGAIQHNNPASSNDGSMSSLSRTGRAAQLSTAGRMFRCIASCGRFQFACKADWRRHMEAHAANAIWFQCGSSHKIKEWSTAEECIKHANQQLLVVFFVARHPRRWSGEMVDWVCCNCLGHGVRHGRISKRRRGPDRKHFELLARAQDASVLG